MDARLDRLTGIASACAVGVRARVLYVDGRGEKVWRELGVLGVGWRRSGWHVYALCQRASAYRLFRLDRMLEVRQTRTPVALLASTGFDARAFASAHLLVADSELHFVTIRLAAPLAALTPVLFPAALMERTGTGVCLCHLYITETKTFADLLQTLGSAAVCVTLRGHAGSRSRAAPSVHRRLSPQAGGPGPLAPAPGRVPELLRGQRRGHREEVDPR